MNGFGDPIPPECDTTTIVAAYTPQVTYCYTYSNCATTNWWAPTPKSDEEQKKAWREYWQGFFKWRGTPYSKLRASIGHRFDRAVRNVPGLRQARKRPLSSSIRSHRQFIAKLNRPAGFLHIRTF